MERPFCVVCCVLSGTGNSWAFALWGQCRVGWLVLSDRPLTFRAVRVLFESRGVFVCVVEDMHGPLSNLRGYIGWP